MTAQASASDFISHVEQKQFDLIFSSAFCYKRNGLSGSMQRHMVQGSEQGRCRGGSFRRADSQHMLLVYTGPGLTLIEKWFVFNIN